MKKQVLLLLSFLFCSALFSQVIYGTYELEVKNGPDYILLNRADVSISKDDLSKKKIWIDNLIPGHSLYAIVSSNNKIYRIPRQQAGEFVVQLGCLGYYPNDKYGEKVVISINNKDDCGIEERAHTDYNRVIKASDIQIEADGTVSLRRNENVAMKELDVKPFLRLENALQYVGYKIK